MRLPNGGEISLTWARAFAPRGVSLHGLGLLPDVCLSGDATPVNVVIDKMFAEAHAIADARRHWRTAPDTPAAHEALRQDCPAEARPDQPVDIAVARRIVSDPALLALTLPDTSPQVAIRP